MRCDNRAMTFDLPQREMIQNYGNRLQAEISILRANGRWPDGRNYH